jgi:hypothetical protein
MGTAEGVCRETEFFIYDPAKKLICTILPDKVEGDKSRLRFTQAVLIDNGIISIPMGSRAVVKHLNNTSMALHIYTPPNFPYQSAIFVDDSQSRGTYVHQGLREMAHIGLRSDGDVIIVERLLLATDLLRETLQTSVVENTADGARVRDASVLEAECEETRFPRDALNLPFVFDGITHFHVFLRHRNGAALLPGFSLEMYHLRSGTTAAPLTGNLIVGGSVRLPSKQGDEYGFKIRSTSEHSLFPYLFYFNPDDYTISVSQVRTFKH